MSVEGQCEQADWICEGSSAHWLGSVLLYSTEE